MKRVALIVASANSSDLPEPDLLRNMMFHGARVVVHDPSEFMRTGSIRQGDKTYKHLTGLLDFNKSGIRVRPEQEEELSKKIALIYARKTPGGGTTSFTIHLYTAMKMAGIDVKLYRFTDHPRNPRMLAKYKDVITEFLTPEAAMKMVKRKSALLIAPEHSKNLPQPDLIRDMMKAGMRVRIADPNEFDVYDYVTDETRKFIKRPICIRPTMKKFFEDAFFIPHPYIRVFKGWQGKDLHEREAACSIARITFVKRPQIILGANRLLPRDMRIVMHGAENRLFTYHKLMKDFPEFKQGGHNLPLVWGISAREARKYKLAIDMTYFPNDGGGSQYSFMEAWDAGTVNVVHTDWLRYKGEMEDGKNCITVKGPNTLASLIKEAEKSKSFRKKLREISKEGTRHLESYHDPLTIARKFYKELTRG